MSASLRGAKAQSLLFGEVVLAQTAAGQSGGWEVAGPRAWARHGLGPPRTVMMVVVGVLKKQGLPAKSLCGEPKALHGGVNMGMEHPPAPCKGLWESICPLVGMKGDAGWARLLGADPGKIQFSSSKK